MTKHGWIAWVGLLGMAIGCGRASNRVGQAGCLDEAGNRHALGSSFRIDDCNTCYCELGTGNRGVIGCTLMDCTPMVSRDAAAPETMRLSGPDTAAAETRLDGSSGEARVSDYPLAETEAGLAVIDPQYVGRNFDALLAGTWLIGWYGGQNHFSWVRFPAAPAGFAFGNSLQVLAETTAPFNVPYWSCSGAGTWSVTQRPATVDMTLPGGCEREILIFDTFRPITSPAGAWLEARILACRGSACGTGASTTLVGLKFPDRICDAAFTSCAQPF